MASSETAAVRPAHLSIARVVRLLAEVRLAVLVVGFASAWAVGEVSPAAIGVVLLAAPFSLVPARSWERRGELLSTSGILLACDLAMTTLVVLLLGGELMIVYGAATVALIAAVAGTRIALVTAVPVVAALSVVLWSPDGPVPGLVVAAAACGIASMAWAGHALADGLRTQAAATEEVARVEQRRAATIERVRIARDLHDTVAGDLAGAVMVAGTLAGRLEREGADERTRRLADQLLEAVRTAHADTRVALHELRRAEVPTAVELVDQCRRWSQRTGVPTAVDVDPGVAGLPREVAEDLRAMLLELLENVRRHADAQKVQVVVTVAEDVVTLAVTDDGRGLEGSLPGAAQGHFGLTGIQERAAARGGHLRHEHPEGGGLRSVVELRTNEG